MPAATPRLDAEWEFDKLRHPKNLLRERDCEGAVVRGKVTPLLSSPQMA